MTRYIIFNEDGEQEIETRRYHCPECGCMVTRIRNKSWHEAQNMKWIVFSDKGVDMNKTDLWKKANTELYGNFREMRGVWHAAQNISPEPDDNPISVDEIDLLRGIRDGRYDPQNWEAELTRIIEVLEDK